MSPAELLNKALSAGPVRKLSVPAMTKAAEASFEGASPQARADALAKLALQKAQLDDIRRRIEVLEARDRLRHTHTLHLSNTERKMNS